MGLQDRDYWKDRYDENLGIRSRPNYKKDTAKLEKMRFFSPQKKGGSAWHWSLQLVLFLFICIGVLAVISFINSFVKN